MRYFYETRTKTETYRGNTFTVPASYEVFDHQRAEPIAVCYDRDDAEAIVDLFNRFRA